MAKTAHPNSKKKHTMSMLLWNLRNRAALLQQQVWDGLNSLRGSPSELWKAYALKFLDSYAYFSLSLIFTLFLSQDFGYSDVEAGTIYGAWGALITVYGLATGFMVDNLGVAWSLRLGFAASLVSRIHLLMTTSRTMLLWNMYVVLPFANCLGIPVLTTGIRRYTHSANRGFAYGLFYVIMNVAALITGPIVDICTKLYNNQLTSNASNNNNDDAENNEAIEEYEPQEWVLTGYRMVLFTTVIANAIAVLITFTMREIKLDTSVPLNMATTPADGMALTNNGPSLEERAGEEGPAQMDVSSKQSSNVSEFTPLQGSAWSILKETLQAKSFWRFLVVCLITLNVRMIFRHLDSTFPKYAIREFGPDVPYGTIYSINPAIIMVLVPLMSAATSHIDPLVMIHYGTYISAVSVFFMAMSTSITASVLFVIVLSIGEASWSPRLYDYTMIVCQEGREGTYMALSSAPLFLAKLPVGFLSGYLLQTYCPEEGPRRSKLMWLIIGLLSASSPILLTVFWRYVSKKDEPVDSDAPNSTIEYTELAEQHPSTRGDDSPSQVVRPIT